MNECYLHFKLNERFLDVSTCNVFVVHTNKGRETPKHALLKRGENRNESGEIQNTQPGNLINHL